MKSGTRTLRWPVLAGIFLIAAATLLLQVTFTRIFSVSIWYHFAFLVVSVALFGFGASGVALALIPVSPSDRRRMGLMPACFALAALLAYLASNRIPFSPFRIATEPVQLLYFALVVLFLTLPFFFAGTSTALILRTWPSHAGRLYAFDLAGAASGTLLLFAALPAIGAAGSVVLTSTLGFGAAFALMPERRWRTVFAVLAIAHLPFLLSPSALPDVRIDESKPLSTEVDVKGGRITFTKWNALSRIDVVEREGIDPMILIDSAAMTSLARPVDDDSPSIRNVSTLAYRLLSRPAAVIIGSGGGMDVQNALALGARSVTCVEINPIIIDLVTGRYRGQVGGVFEDPRVTLIQDEGRSYLDRMGGRTDVVQLTLIDTWAAGASGAYSLTENYLYTVEAFRTYLEHLAPGGMLAITRWYFETPRLATLARAALKSMGIDDAGRHVLVLRHRISDAFLVKREPFTPEEVATARAFAEQIRGKIEHDPVQPGRESFFDVYFAQPDPRPLIEATPTAIAPVHDDSPFFFQMGRWRDLRLSKLAAFTNRSFLEPLVLPVGQIALVSALAIGLALSVVLLAIPLLARRVPRTGRFGWLGYFLALGLAFVTVEVVLMQRFALFLGHPTYSVTITLFAILLFSGLGSGWSSRRAGPAARVIGPIAIALPLAIAALTFAVPPITGALIGLPHPIRLAIAIALIAPVAFLMGVPFPTGVRVAGAADPGLVAWGWAANGCASVVGSVAAVLGAMAASFSTMLVIAGAVYLVALLGLARSGLHVPR